MAPSDSMFSIEIVLEELKSFVKCRDFIIRSQFADIFSIILKDPSYIEKDSLAKIYPKNKFLRRNLKPLFKKYLKHAKPQVGQTAMFSCDIDDLISYMQKYPIELSLWSKLYPKYKLASTNVSWNLIFINFLHSLREGNPHTIVTAKGQYNIFDEFTSRRMAAVKLTIKLNYLTRQYKTQYCMSDDEPDRTRSPGLCSNPSTIMNRTQNNVHIMSPEEIGIIKTIYSGGKKPKKSSSKRQKKQAELKINKEAEQPEEKLKPDVTIVNKKVNSSLLSLVKSQSDMDKNKQMDLVRSKSCSSIHRDQLNILDYIFGDHVGPFGNQVYCVGYFTIENDKVDSPTPSSKDSPTKITPTSAKSTPTSAKSTPTSDKSAPTSDKNTPKGVSKVSSKASAEVQKKETISGESFKMKFCQKECSKNPTYTGSVNLSTCSFDIPKEIDPLPDITRCTQLECEHTKFRVLPPPPDDRILLDITNLKKDCCRDNKDDDINKVETVVGGMKAKMKIGASDPCFCECECRFGFMKKTTYCKVCRGYEILGEEHGEARLLDMPYPCPVYHKLTDKIKSAATVVEVKQRGGKPKSTEPKSIEPKSIDSEKDTKKSKKKKKDDKFKFNYGYTAPQIGHSRCALPCTGTMGEVPRRMGWLWTADNVPGLKFRPSWKPGAANKHVVRLLKIAKNPEEAFAKKKRKKPTGKPKRPLKRPLLTVHKKDGEYKVCLETMKTYAKPRAINQFPYEDKDPMTYTIGRTDEENYQRRKKKERASRRLEREQREFIQSAFRDMCQEICLKTYQQALGILPDDIPNCTCYPAEPGADRTDLDRSCSCSEDSVLSFSDTDSDEWMVEITPPVAMYDPTFKIKKVALSETGTQYTYLDYRVKLLDRYGNPVPRFFIGPDGKEQCSDLGGFWDADHKDWIEINVDGYIGPDGRWAPMVFIGPAGENVDAETGKFQAADGTWYVVGIDGYVDVNGKWRSYPKQKGNDGLSPGRKQVSQGIQRTGKNTPEQRGGDQGKGGKNEKSEKQQKQNKRRKNKQDNLANKKSEATWSCFGDASAKYLSEMGIMGHGHDRTLLLDTLNKLIADGENVKIPRPVNLPRSRKKSLKQRHSRYDDIKCRHATPPSKGVIATDEDGNKIYFRLKDTVNPRPKERIATLTDQGISLSSFHVPCFHSFINRQTLKGNDKSRRYRQRSTPTESEPNQRYRYAIS